ncbi:MAG: hypothetical protein ACYC7F_10865 [Gemmatimonadaceae bacterium]
MSVGWGDGPATGALPAYGERVQSMVLQAREGQHRRERVVMQSQPTPLLEVIEADFFLQLQALLLADPADLDRCGERALHRVHGVVRWFAFVLPVRAPFVR